MTTEKPLIDLSQVRETLQAIRRNSLLTRWIMDNYRPLEDPEVKVYIESKYGTLQPATSQG